MPSSASARDTPATRRSISFAEMDSQTAAAEPCCVRYICARGFANMSTASRKHFVIVGYSELIAATLAHGREWRNASILAARVFTLTHIGFSLNSRAGIGGRNTRHSILRLALVGCMISPK